MHLFPSKVNDCPSLQFANNEIIITETENEHEITPTKYDHQSRALLKTGPMTILTQHRSPVIPGNVQDLR